MIFRLTSFVLAAAVAAFQTPTDAAARELRTMSEVRQIEVLFYFYGAREPIDRLGVELKSLGFSTRPTLTDPGVIATKCIDPDAATFDKCVEQAEALAKKYEVELDGWEREVTPTACGQ